MYFTRMESPLEAIPKTNKPQLPFLSLSFARNPTPSSPTRQARVGK
jgi:hypothetical protein